MSKATFWQRGETIDYKNDTSAVIEENTVIPIKTRIGIAGTYMNPGQIGSLHVTGVFEIAKASGEEIAMGDEVFYDGTVITRAKDSNTPAGYAVASATTTDTSVLVKLLG